MVKKEKSTPRKGLLSELELTEGIKMRKGDDMNNVKKQDGDTEANC